MLEKQMSRGKKIAISIMIFFGFFLFLAALYGYIANRYERVHGQKAYGEMVQYVKDHSSDIIDVSSLIHDQMNHIVDKNDYALYEFRSSLTEDLKEKYDPILDKLSIDIAKESNSGRIYYNAGRIDDTSSILVIYVPDSEFDRYVYNKYRTVQWIDKHLYVVIYKKGC